MMIDMFVAAMLAVLKFQTLYLILPNSPDLSAVVSGCKMVTGVIVRDKMQRNVFRLREFGPKYRRNTLFNAPRREVRATINIFQTAKKFTSFFSNPDLKA